jgi:S-adenosylmethionine:tRNA ribosyltransferase-isomerase
VKTAELAFERPPGLEATMPAETNGGSRDGVRLLVSHPEGRSLVPFRSLGDELRAGDLLVVNRSATLPASLSAEASFGPFLLNLSTSYGRGIWLAEPRFGTAHPGPVPLQPGDRFRAVGLSGTFVAPYPGLPRLGFVQLAGDVGEAMRRFGRPIRYGYVAGSYPIDAYRAVYADRPGSAEMPSAGRPFTRELLQVLESSGVRRVAVTLHAGVSSVEIDSEQVRDFPLYPEPFEVPPATVDAIRETKASGGRVIAVGTTVVRALEAAALGGRLAPAEGFTRAFVRPERPPTVADALLTGFHDPRTSHLAMLAAFAGTDRLRDDYRFAIERRMLWHEFGDSHLIFRDRAGA